MADVRNGSKPSVREVPAPSVVFERSTRYVGLPVVLITALAAYLAWQEGGSGLLLALMVIVNAVAIGVLWYRRQRLGEQPSPVPTSVVLTAVLLAQFGIGVWSYAYRGLDGGFWINLTTISFLAGILLAPKQALLIGLTGALTFVAIGIASGQMDGAHAPTLVVGTSYVFLLAAFAAAHKSAIADVNAAEQEIHVRELEGANVELDGVIESLTEGLLTTDGDGRVKRWNRALEHLTGTASAQATGMAVERAFPLVSQGMTLGRDEHPCIRALQGHVFAGSPAGVEERELEIVAPDGRAVPVTVSAAPLLTAEGPAGVAAVVLDVTRERELATLRDALVSMVSHELRTPLTMILGFSEMLTSGGLTEYEQAECSRQIFEAAQSLNALIEDLLSASAIESGRLELNSRSVPIAAIVETTRQSLPTRERERVSADVSPLLVGVGDPDRLAQVVNNLLSNALKFSDESAEVLIRATDAGDEIIVTVTDRGIGIDPEELEGLFGKFARADDERVKKAPGTGLGLYVVERLVAMHGGRIEAESTLGRGTSISFTLPRA